MSDLSDQLKERRLERMRLGQSVAEIIPLLSDPEIRVSLVPLLESEYDQCMRATALLDVPENVAGAGVRDRHERREILARAIREPNDLSKRVFASALEMMDSLELEDVTHLYDSYVEMTFNFSPHIAQLKDEEIEFLKDLWQTQQWKGLSGRQLYALNRFISTLSLSPLSDRLLGSTLTT